VRQRKRLGRIKELSEITNRTSSVQAGEPDQSAPAGPDTRSGQEVPTVRPFPSSERASARDTAEEHTIARAGEEGERLLTISLPAAVVRQLEEQARRDGVSLRSVLLRALAASGHSLGSNLPMHRVRRPVSFYSDLARAIAIASFLSR
jgi:hypothetical protein